MPTIVGIRSEATNLLLGLTECKLEASLFQHRTNLRSALLRIQGESTKFQMRERLTVIFLAELNEQLHGLVLGENGEGCDCVEVHGSNISFQGLEVNLLVVASVQFQIFGPRPRKGMLIFEYEWPDLSTLFVGMEHIGAVDSEP